MTTYYIRTDGSNSNLGTGPSTTQAWLTITKALTTVAAGDIIYVAPGTYRSETGTSFTKSGTAGNAIQVIGDVDASHFAGADVAVSPGDVVWTSYLTNDYTTPATSFININGQSYLTFQNILFIIPDIGSSNIAATTSHSTNITFQKCTFNGLNAIQAGIIVYTNITGNVAANWLIDSCIFVGGRNSLIKINGADPGSAVDTDLNFVIKDSLLICGNQADHITFIPAGTTTGKAGGIKLQNCTLFSGANGLRITNANGSTGAPCTSYNNIFLQVGTAISAGASGAIIEDYSTFAGVSTPRTLTSTGANSQVVTNTLAPLFEIGQWMFTGRMPRPFLSPSRNCPMLGFGNQAGYPTTDMWGRDKPSGGTILGSSAQALTGTATSGDTTHLNDTLAAFPTTGAGLVGCICKITAGTGSGQMRSISANTGTQVTFAYAGATIDNTSVYSIYTRGSDPGLGAQELHDFATADLVTFDVTPAIRMQGPGDHEFQIPVDAVTTTLAIKVNRDAAYGAGTNPTLEVVANGEIGVSGATVTDTGSSGAFNTITLPGFTPTAKGVVKIRLHSYASPVATVHWDTLTIS